MTAISPPRRDGGWGLQLALILSILVHLALLVAALFSADVAGRVFDVHPSLAIAQRPPDEIVMITAPLRFEHRAAPAASSPSHGTAVAHAAPSPRVIPPAHFRFPSSGFAAPGQAGTNDGVSPAEQALRDAIARNFGRNVSAARDPAAVPARYRLRMLGIRAKLKHGQGIYYPVRGWRDGGLDYYDVAYEYIYPDGRDERGAVPWPIHFDPQSDPFFSPDPQALVNTPMPGPPPGYTPPGDLGKVLRAYFPNLRFEDQDG